MGETRGFPKLTSLKQSFPTFVDQHSLGEANREKQTHRVSTFRKKKKLDVFFSSGPKSKKDPFCPVNFFGGHFKNGTNSPKHLKPKRTNKDPTVIQSFNGRIPRCSHHPCHLVSASLPAALLLSLPNGQAANQNTHSLGFFLSDEC